MVKNNKILLAFYGDDFTGSTDALEFISRAGAKTILFTEPPDTETLKAFPDLQAYGVAGITRSLPADEMEKILMPAFEQIKASEARHVHYKVCSTFDSSSDVGSIGKAIDCGKIVFANKKIPVLGGMPALGRYCVFGNIFARMGIGGEGNIYRLDRHPSMSKHPVTPADESDLRLHLSKQTDKKIGLIDVVQLNKPVSEWDNAFKNEEDVILIDTIYESQLDKIGAWLNSLQENNTQFSVGGSGIEVALGNCWQHAGLLKEKTNWEKIEKAVPVLVISGSCSPVTTDQITYAKANGFEEVVIDALQVCNGQKADTDNCNEVNEFLSRGKNVVVHTGRKNTANLPSWKLGAALGTIARIAAEKELVKRIVISGGDTSSYAAKAMGIDAIEMVAPLVSGAPLCKVISKNKYVNGMEVNFKGGQVGDEKYFTLF